MDSQGALSTGEALQGDDFTSNLVPLLHKYFESEGKAEERGEERALSYAREEPLPSPIR